MRSSVLTRTCSRGSTTVELVLITPALIVLLLFLIMGAQGSHLAAAVKHAADSAARAGSLASLRSASIRAHTAALDDLENANVKCEKVDVVSDVKLVGRTKLLEVRVTCEVPDRDVLGLRLNTRRVTAVSTEVVDVYRAD